MSFKSFPPSPLMAVIHTKGEQMDAMNITPELCPRELDSGFASIIQLLISRWVSASNPKKYML